MKVTMVVVIFLILMPTKAMAQAQGDYGARLRSKDGRWLLPVATLINGSDEEKHTGRGSVLAWDLVAPYGTPVYAMGPGKVEYAGCNNAGGYGCWLFINHGEFKAVYGHMIEGSIKVKSGQAVDANTVIGQVGRTGMTSFGPHTHLEMQKPGGGRFRIDQWFDRSGMRFCSLCSVSGEPAVWHGATAVQESQAQPSAPITTITTSRLMSMLNTAGPDKTASVMVVVFFALCLMCWFGNLYSRVFVIAFGTSLLVASYALWIALPVNEQPVKDVQQPAQVSGSVAWKTAYAFMRKWEGAKCVHDPVRTFKGVTQGTYDAWRKSQGVGKADVCTSLTEQQAEAIYYQRYWLASGADKLSPATAIVVFDHAVNAGVGEAKSIIAQCGNDAGCAIKARLADYKTKSNYRQYGQAWTNRVNDLVAYLKGNN